MGKKCKVTNPTGQKYKIHDTTFTPPLEWLPPEDPPQLTRAELGRWPLWWWRQGEWLSGVLEGLGDP